MSTESINIVLDLSPEGQVLSFSVQKAISNEELTEINSNSDFLESCPICTCRISVFTRQAIPKLKTEALSDKEDFPVESYNGFGTKAENVVSSEEDEKPIVELFLVNMKEEPDDKISKSPVKQRKRRIKNGPCSIKENIRRCLHCNLIFRTNSQMTSHQQRYGIVGGPTELVSDAVKCPDHCGRYFNNEEELQKHLKSVNAKPVLHKCDHCPEVFRAQITLQNHLFEHGPVECPKCKIKFKDSVRFNKHIKIHVETKSFRCKLCNSSCDSEESLAHHIRWAHENKRSCSFCGKIFNRRSDLFKHEKTHEDHRPHQCDHCGKSYKYPYALITHLQKHQGIVFICDLCGIKKKYKPLMRYHMLKCHMTSENIFQCTQCPKQFTVSFEYKIHMKRHFLKRKFPCSTCGKLFPDNTTLQKHTNSMHVELSKRKKFECETCGKVVLSKNSLKTHMNKHKEVSEFKCRYCSLSLTTAHNLQRHEMIHTDERPFTCQTCGKSFRHPDTLKTHIRLHTGEKPYECPLEECKKRFSDRGCFRSHLVVHEKQLNIKLIKKQNYLNDV